MSVKRHDYVLVGINVIEELDKMSEEQKEKLFDSDLMNARKYEVGEICYLFDGYSEEYLIVGIPIAVSHDDYEGLPYSELNVVGKNSLFELIKRVEQHVLVEFGNVGHAKLISLAHWI